MPFIPQAMCARCQHVFALPKADEVTCPVCGHRGAPGRLMRVSGFPDMETFTRNWQRAKTRSPETSASADED